MVVGGGGREGGPKLTPHHENVCKFSLTLRSYIYARLRRITFKFGNFTNMKALFPVVSTDFPLLVPHVKTWKKKRENVYSLFSARTDWLFAFVVTTTTSSLIPEKLIWCLKYQSFWQQYLQATQIKMPKMSSGWSKNCASQ